MGREVVMESQRYLDARRIVCVGCDASSFEGTDRCCKCNMPLAISMSVGSRNLAPTIIPILGGRDVGKTVYIAMLLHMLRRGHRSISCPTSKSSLALQKHTMDLLKRRRFPPRTVGEPERWNWVQCELEFQSRTKKQTREWVTPDLAGESLIMELAHPGVFPALTMCVVKASGTMLMIDALKVSSPNTAEDLFATQLATYVASHARRSGIERLTVDIPTAVVFTKTDNCCDAVRDPEGFAKRNLPGFYAYLQRNMPRNGFFATSVVGGVTKVAAKHGGYSLPMHVQPKGIVEPLVWLLSQ